MIVKNEEAHLENCLNSAAGIFDEIVIVDTGSTDKTKEIAARYTDKVLDFEWIDDFAAARNYAFEHATSDYLMWLDADDVIPEKSRVKLIALKSVLPTDVDMVQLPYNTSFDENGEPTFSYYRERIVRNCPQARWSGYIHEAIIIFGKNLHLDIPIEHHKLRAGDTNRNLRIYESHMAKGNELGPRDMFYYGRELYYHQRNQDAVNMLSMFLGKGQGWKENNIEACKTLAACYYRLNQPIQALASLLRSFVYDAPRAEVCCQLGAYFFEHKQYGGAIYWYKQALAMEPNYNTGAFVLPDCYGYIPALQLCLCYARIGDAKNARHYNAIAEGYKSNASTKHNDEIFHKMEEAGLLAPEKSA
jgi:glycosyltransferase involved in cell wall biosynthesis